MLRRVCICLAVVAALSAAPAAAGDGPLFTTQGGEGVLTSDGTLRFVTLGVANGTRTELEAIQTKDGVVRQTLDLTESWGTPYIPSGSAGLSHEGRTLVLASTTYGSPSKFLVLDPRTLKIWVMNGSPMTRTTSADGRWVYTLYMNPGGFPFIHALDTVRGVAHCVGLPWTAVNQGPVYNFHLALKGSS